MSSINAVADTVRKAAHCGGCVVDCGDLTASSSDSTDQRVAGYCRRSSGGDICGRRAERNWQARVSDEKVVEEKISDCWPKLHGVHRPYGAIEGWFGRSE